MKDNILYCQFCGKECKNTNSFLNHERCCPKNPNRQYKNGMTGKTAWNKGLSIEKDERIKKAQETYRKNQVDGKHVQYGHPHTEDVKLKLRDVALKNNLGGFHMRRGIYYNGIKLDSSYEVIVAEELDKNNVTWTRPKKFQYHIDNKLHYYTPDFYLPDYDIYLDPKNDFLINNVNPKLGFKDIDKINEVEKENNIKILILDKTELTWNCILNHIKNITLL